MYDIKSHARAVPGSFRANSSNFQTAGLQITSPTGARASTFTRFSPRAISTQNTANIAGVMNTPYKSEMRKSIFYLPRHEE